VDRLQIQTLVSNTDLPKEAFYTANTLIRHLGLSYSWSLRDKTNAALLELSKHSGIKNQDYIQDWARGPGKLYR
jgi:hypothetical protein